MKLRDFEHARNGDQFIADGNKLTLLEITSPVSAIITNGHDDEEVYFMKIYDNTVILDPRSYHENPEYVTELKWL